MTGNGGEYPPFYFVYAKIVILRLTKSPLKNRTSDKNIAALNRI